ncbi:hypothetical protein [uncultured Sphingomonas sp.]|uniref:hypothetical protein n=1 Tax=uncultured Sphingomonas sp. TaxID=158754 RepID=UPI0035CA9F2F
MILRALALALALAIPATPPLPRDVRLFIDRRAGCDHWRGEYAEDPVRRRQIERGIRKAARGSIASLTGCVDPIAATRARWR